MELSWLGQLIGLYKMVLIVRIVLSWVPHRPDNQAVIFLYKITEPVLQPVRRAIPSIGGIDISPIVVFIGFGLIEKAF